MSEMKIDNAVGMERLWDKSSDAFAEAFGRDARPNESPDEFRARYRKEQEAAGQADPAVIDIVGVKFRSRKDPTAFSGREYTYKTTVPLQVDDVVTVPAKNGAMTAMVTRIGIPESELHPSIEYRTITTPPLEAGCAADPFTDAQRTILEAWDMVEELDPDISTEKLVAIVEDMTGADAGDISQALFLRQTMKDAAEAATTKEEE